MHLTSRSGPGESARQGPCLQISLLWGDRLVGLEHFASGEDVLIGSGDRTDFTIHSQAVGDSFALARLRCGVVEVNVPKGADVRVLQQDAEPRTSAALRASGRLIPEGETEALSLGLNEHAIVSLASQAFVVRPIVAPERVTAPILRDGDYTYFKIASFGLMTFVALATAILVTPLLEELPMDVLAKPSRHLPVRARPDRISLREKKASALEGEKVRLEEGKVGERDGDKQRAAPRKSTPSDSKEARDRAAIHQVGILGAIGSSGGINSLLGASGLDQGIHNHLGALHGRGPEVGLSLGIRGVGSRPGGGGASLSLIGGLGTQGNGPGRDPKGIGLKGGGKESLQIVREKLVVQDGMDRELIAKVVRQNQRQIKHCYDSELQSNPELAGKVAVSWTIDPAGAVADASVAESTLGNSTVEGCILAKVRRWKFPEPKGGGVVAVNFPWVFKSAEGEE